MDHRNRTCRHACVWVSILVLTCQALYVDQWLRLIKVRCTLDPRLQHYPGFEQSASAYLTRMPSKPNGTPRKRTRARNKRTTAAEESISDIASSSSSSSSNEESSEEPQQAAPAGASQDISTDQDDEVVEQRKKKRKRGTKNANNQPIESSVLTKESQMTNPKPAVPSKTPQEKLDADFEVFYLRQVTSEFAGDLEKLRSAPDFKDSSVPVLVRALKQGTTTFSDDEKRMVLGLEERR